MKTFYLKHFFKTSILMLTLLLGTSSWGQVAYTGNFGQSTGATGSYAANNIITLESQTWLASYSYFGSGEFRLGHNKATGKVPAKFISTAPEGASIEMQWDISNVKTISLETGGKYGTPQNWYIFESTDSGASWTQVATSAYTLAGTWSYTATTPNMSARYAFVVSGTGSPRVVLNTITITTEGPVTQDPTLSISTEEITGLNYIFGNGPSDAQSFTLSGTNLDGTEDVMIGLDDGASSDFEISLNATSGYDTDLFIEGYDGTDTEIFVRLKAGKAVGDAYGDIITIFGDNTNEVYVLLLGEVTAIPSVPVVSDAELTGNVGVAFSYQVVATNEPTSYAISSDALPAGLSLDTETGLITGTPTLAGSFITGITATNVAGTSAESIFIFEIAKGTQTLIGFEDQNKYITDTSFSFPAVTDMGYVVDYDSDNTAVATVSGNTITITGIGTTTIWAMSDGDANWEDYIETITLTVTEVPILPNVIISQVYEGASNNKWIELTNLGATDADLSQLKVAIWSVTGDSGNGNIIPGEHTSALTLTGTLSPGATFLIRHSGAANNVPHNPMPTAISGGNVTNFNGNDALALMDLDDNIIDAFGDGISNKDKSYHRKSEVSSPNATFTLSEWEERTLADIAAADDTMTEYIGTHIFGAIVWTTDNQWSNITGPTFANDVIIEGTLTVGELNNIDAKSLTVNGALTIADGGVINLKGAITNNGSFIVENGGNLIQTADYTGSNNGSMTVKKNSSFIKHLDYTIWSSPVAGQGLQAFSPQTLDYRIYSYATTTDTWVQATGNFEAGRGYMFRAPNDFVTTPYIYNGEFNGVANNGDVTVNFTTVGTYQDLGNPYPSNMSAAQFWAANPGTATLYFWTNTNAWDTATQEYVGNNWATYSSIGGTAAVNGDKSPTNIIQTGQGFVVETDTDQVISSVTFKNTMRTADNTGVFFRSAAPQRHRMWLGFSNENMQLNQILIGYMDGATNNFDLGIDSRMFSYNGSALFSIIENETDQFTIQGRAMPFTSADVVPLGLKAISAGTFTISLTNFDGLFTEDQDIFLNDNLTQTQHNLKDGGYTFVSTEGTFLDRFEVVYTATMSINNPELANAWVIYNQDNNFNIEAQSFELKDVVVYDMLGRVIYQSAAEGNSHVITNLDSNAVMIVKITTTDGQEFSRKVAK